MLEQLFGIQYTGSLYGTVYGYYLTWNGDDTYTARVHKIEVVGENTPIGEYTVPTFGHGKAVKAHVEHWMFA